LQQLFVVHCTLHTTFVIQHRQSAAVYTNSCISQADIIPCEQTPHGFQ